MSTELELARDGGILPAYASLADRIARTEFVPKGLRGRPEAVLACILYGHEVGMGPMQSLSSIDVIEGKPSVKPEAMRGLVRQAGHSIWVEDRTNTSVTVAGFRSEDREHVERITWTMDDAKAAGLAQKDVWKKYPRSMLLARATSELCRSMFSDVIAGLSYTAEEVDFRDALEAEDVVELASDDERVALEEAVASLSDDQRSQLVARWKDAGLGSLRTDAAVPLLAEQVAEAWGLISAVAADVQTPDGDDAEPVDAEVVAEPDAAPEAPTDPDEGRPVLHDNPISQKQNRTIFALLRKAGVADDDRHQFAAAVLDRPVDSFLELSADDAGLIIDRLTEMTDDGDAGRPFD